MILAQQAMAVIEAGIMDAIWLIVLVIIISIIYSLEK